MDSLKWRERKALRRFQIQDTIYSYQLPHGVSYKTMDGLVARGLLAVVDSAKGRYSMDYGWRLIR